MAHKGVLVVTLQVATTAPSAPANSVSSGDQASVPGTASPGQSSVPASLPVLTLQSWMVRPLLLGLAEAAVLPSGEMARATAPVEAPSNVREGVSVSAVDVEVAFGVR